MAKIAVILHEPDIPQNSGNIIRLCANTGAELHLVKPLGWGELNDKKLRRAGLDYHEFASVVVHENWDACQQYFKGRQIWAIETSGKKLYHQVEYAADCVLLFGSETRGLPDSILQEIGIEQVLRLPMLPTQRSLNLSNSVAIAVYEVWRQYGFNGGV
ncbi:MAG: tRNA (cytidine(34)-2'-O)-methyltransferase [Neisseriaceae bacterium]|nr:MAG: tRNA (cytidine(34)-2'-O)-methyltransferase [Neisseriaceae bacterium]